MRKVWTKGVEAAEAFITYMDEESKSNPDYLTEFGAAHFFSALEVQNQLDEKGRSSRYWHFAPAWQIDNAFWQEWFGEQDPAVVIAFYFKSAYKPEQPTVPRTPVKPREDDASSLFGQRGPSMAGRFAARWEAAERRARDEAIESRDPGVNAFDVEPEPYRLRNSDMVIARWILDAYSRNLAGHPGREQPRAARAMLLRCLVTASGWGEWLDGGLTWRDEDFADVLDVTPDWLLDHMWEYWNDLRGNDALKQGMTEDERALLTAHARFFADLAIRYADPSQKHLRAHRPKHSFTEDEIVFLLQDLQDVEFLNSDISELHDEVLSAIVRGRQEVFGGVLPFKLEDFWLSSLDTGDGAPWLARLDCFLPERSGGAFSPFWVFPPAGTKPNQDGGQRTDPRAVRRFEAFASTLADMRREGLDDLAAAWWAFFVATQAMAFRGLGLPAPHVKRVAEIAAELLPDPALEKAVHLATAVSAEQRRLVDANVLGKLIVQVPEPERGVNVVHFSVSPEVAENCLRKKIGAGAWAKLHPQSRRDLIEAEQLWARSAPELGYREDWGGLILDYARAIECEVRIIASPLLEVATSYGLCPPSEPMLGPCLNAGRKMLKHLKKNPHLEIHPDIEARVELFGELIERDGEFLANVRDRAAHANREQPINSVEFARWRDAMFARGLFTRLVSLA